MKLRSTFSLLSSNRESKSIVSPSDNSGLPMLLSTENHQYPVLVEQMIYRTQVRMKLLRSERFPENFSKFEERNWLVS